MYLVIHIWPDRDATVMPVGPFPDFADAQAKALRYSGARICGVEDGHRYMAVELPDEVERNMPAHVPTCSNTLVAAEPDYAAEAAAAYCEECGTTPCQFHNPESL